MDKRQFSYTALEKLTGLAQASVSEKMRGVYNFTARDVAKLVEIFRLSAEYLLEHD